MRNLDQRLRAAFWCFGIALVGVCVWAVLERMAVLGPRVPAVHTYSACETMQGPSERRTADSIHDFDIPEGNFGFTGACWRSQSGLGIGWTEPIPNAEQIHTNALKGRMRAIDALVRLVANTQLGLVTPSTSKERVLWLTAKGGRVHGESVAQKLVRREPKGE